MSFLSACSDGVGNGKGVSTPSAASTSSVAQPSDTSSVTRRTGVATPPSAAAGAVESTTSSSASVATVAGTLDPATSAPSSPPTFQSVDADVVVIALGSLKFDKAMYDGKADLTIGYLNTSSDAHRLHIDGVDKFELAVSKLGEAQIADIRLNHGTYTIFCAVPGHRAAGMEAKLVIP
jgi:uncharacterized cupredoxin-like copper-binding protein